MVKITAVIGHEILDSRGNPTVGATVTLGDGTTASAAVPSGASTGSREAVELRDGDPRRFGGKGVSRAVNNVNGDLAGAVTGIEAIDQRAIDRAMIDLDGTPNKGRVGANAILAVSLAALRAGAASSGNPLYVHIANLTGNDSAIELPVPMFNVLNGGAHAMGSTDFQEFMLVPAGIESFSEALRCGAEMYEWLNKKLHADGHATTVGDEGGFAPQGLTNRGALEYATAAIEGAGYRPGEDVFIALDPASSEFYSGGVYDLSREDRKLSSEEMVEEYSVLSRDFPIYSVEDGLAEDDWSGWEVLTGKIGDRVQLVGDDLYVTQARYVQQGIDQRAGNAVLVKLNQVGSVSETLDTVQLARDAGFGIVISHRSGETEDTSIADLAVGTAAGQIKTGAPARSERIAKYNRLLRIEELLGGRAQYAGKRVLPNC
ncbi:MAG: phosphopyruvate hydratase [Dehalococcoidia bacterium]|jgi:enolase|nr:phosphopyruvate hydratase [Dehalococcoidia bacterium]